MEGDLQDWVSRPRRWTRAPLAKTPGVARDAKPERRSDHDPKSKHRRASLFVRVALPPASALRATRLAGGRWNEPGKRKWVNCSPDGGAPMLDMIVRFCRGVWIVATSLAISPSISGQTSRDQTDRRRRVSQKVQSVVYTNERYGFRFSLPESWRGYSVSVTEWEGGDGRTYQPGEAVPPPEKGPLISIAHPGSTKSTPRQNIPIMVFTRAQWRLIEEGKLIVSAAPIGPSELGRNTKYVFALPPRYNYAFLDGWEEVEQIVSKRALHAF